MRNCVLLCGILFLCLVICSCGKQIEEGSSLVETQQETESIVVSEEISTEEITETESETEEAYIPIAKRIAELQESDTIRIFDECGVLDTETFATYNVYAQALSEEYGIEVAVVITEDIGDRTPSKFAKAYFSELYPDDENDDTTTSGFLILINNDTYEDIVYTKGSAKVITSSAIELAIAKATPYLVVEDYDSALEILLLLGDALSELETGE